MRFVIVAFALVFVVACSSAPITPVAPAKPTAASPSAAQLPTPNIEATIQTRVAATVRAIPVPPSAPTPSGAAPNPPVAATDEPITLTGTRTMKTAPFKLNGGNYAISWSATDAPNGVGCVHGGTLKNVDGSAGSQSVSEGGPDKGQMRSGTTNTYNVKPGTYYLDMISGCASWSVTISPQ